MLAFVLGWEVFLGITGPPGGVPLLLWPMWLAVMGWIGWCEGLESRVLRIRCGLCSRRGGGTVLHVSLLPMCPCQVLCIEYILQGRLELEEFG